MSKIHWVTFEVNGNSDALPKNGAWCHVDVKSMGNTRRKVRFINGRFFDKNNHAVNPKSVLNWHVPMDPAEMAAMNNTRGVTA